MARTTSLHWYALALMLGPFLAGILLAAGHHSFYRGLSGEEVPHTDVGMGQLLHISQQRANLIAGTTFAFFFKICLCIACGAAYVQLFWRAIRNRPVKVKAVDTLYSAPSGPLALLDVRTWAKHPALLWAPIVIWLIPITALVTPATLSVVQSSSQHSRLLNVSRVNFDSLNFASLPIEDSTTIVNYTGPQLAVSRAVTATAANGATLSFPAPANDPDAAYDLDFTGPGLACANVRSDVLSDITSQCNSMTSYPNASCLWYGGGLQGPPSYGYLAWAPTSSSYLPFLAESCFEVTPGTYGPSDTSLPMQLYIAAFPRMGDNAGFAGSAALGPSTWMEDPTVVHCTLQNVSYHTHFKWVNGTQSVDVTVADVHNNVSVWDDNTLMSHSAETEYIPAAQSWAYQAVMDAFGSLLVGSIYTSRLTNYALITDTQAMITALADTQELAFIQAYTAPSYVGSNFPSPVGVGLTGTGAALEDSSVSNATVYEDPPPLAAVVEQLFQNITISLMTAPTLQFNYAVGSYLNPPATNVTFTKYVNVYLYSAVTLWLAYGIAIAFATACVVAGFVAMLANGVSYSNNFSTTMRATAHAEVSTSLSEDDVGQDPLPKDLALANITFIDAKKGRGSVYKTVPMQDKGED